MPMRAHARDHERNALQRRTICCAVTVKEVLHASRWLPSLRVPLPIRPLQDSATAAYFRAQTLGASIGCGFSPGPSFACHEDARSPGPKPRGRVAAPVTAAGALGSPQRSAPVRRARRGPMAVAAGRA